MMYLNGMEWTEWNEQTEFEWNGANKQVNGVIDE
jgi:hypothetical protein